MDKNKKLKWSKDRCAQAASQHQSRTEFKSASPSAYSSARRNGWLDEICAHMSPSRKPDGYWTAERCHEAALRYKTRKEFLQGDRSAYSAATRLGCLIEICNHMARSTKPPNYWTKERCDEEASQYSSRQEFLKKSASAFRIAQRNGWLNHVCAHMDYINKPPGYWTRERCQEHALRYTTRNEFHLKNDKAYRIAQAHGWLNEICSHMDYQVLPRHYWTKDRVREEAKKYETRMEFLREAGGAYGAAQQGGWLDEVCEHMAPVDHGWKYSIYSIVNKRLNQAYIGLTRQSFEARSEQHKNRVSSNRSRFIASEPDTEFLQLSGYDFSVDEIADQERRYFEQFKAEGWELLNDEKLIGHLGLKGASWNKEKCRAEALKYATTAEFRRFSQTAYDAAKRNGWLMEITEGLEQGKLLGGGRYWSKEKCRQEAMNFTSRKEFREHSRAYAAARKYGWLDEITQHIPRARRPVSSYTFEECEAEARQFKTRSAFYNAKGPVYRAAKKCGWLDEICSHMGTQQINWTKELVKQEAFNYESKSAFRQAMPKAYKAAKDNNWLDEICEHMITTQKPHGS